MNVKRGDVLATEGTSSVTYADARGTVRTTIWSVWIVTGVSRDYTAVRKMKDAHGSETTWGLERARRGISNWARKPASEVDVAALMAEVKERGWKPFASLDEVRDLVARHALADA